MDDIDKLVEPSNAEQADWADATRDYVAGIERTLLRLRDERDEQHAAADMIAVEREAWKARALTAERGFGEAMRAVSTNAAANARATP